MSDGDLQNIVVLIIGDRGTGKTPLVVGDEKVNIPGMIKIYLAKAMKVLFVDQLDHPSYRQFKKLETEQLKGWKKGPFRCYTHDRKLFKALMQAISFWIWNTAIFFEDAFRYEREKLSDEMIAIIGNSKNQNNDIYLMYHHWKFVPKNLYIYLDYIEVFKTVGPPDQREASLLGKHFDRVCEVVERVNAHPSKYYHESIYVKQ